MLVLLITCEHAGNKIPSNYKELFHQYKNILKSHRGYDAGALDLARFLSKNFAGSFYYTEFSRLLVDTNRSLNNRSLFSEISKKLDDEEKKVIIEKYYNPHRELIAGEIKSSISAGHTILHIAVHSFVPVLNDKIRNADIGILYDPLRQHEKEFCGELKKLLNSKNRNIHVRMNYPYKGADDGLTAYLRKIFKNKYIGIELEMNQRLLKNGVFSYDIKKLLNDVLRGVLKGVEKYYEERNS